MENGHCNTKTKLKTFLEVRRTQGDLLQGCASGSSYLVKDCVVQGHAHAAAFFTKICSGGEDTAQACSQIDEQQDDVTSCSVFLNQ
eukprot:1683418-Amphidinium_carterae.1